MSEDELSELLGIAWRKGMGTSVPDQTWLPATTHKVGWFLILVIEASPWPPALTEGRVFFSS